MTSKFCMLFSYLAVVNWTMKSDMTYTTYKILLVIWDSIVSRVIGLQAGRSRVWILAGVRDFSLLRNIQTNSGAHPSSHLMGTGAFLVQSGWVMKLTTHLSLMLRLRMFGAIPLLPLYAFMAWTGTVLPLRYCWGGQVACMGEKNAWKVLVEKPEE